MRGRGGGGMNRETEWWRGGEWGAGSGVRGCGCGVWKFNSSLSFCGGEHMCDNALTECRLVDAWAFCLM